MVNFKFITNKNNIFKFTLTLVLKVTFNFNRYFNWHLATSAKYNVNI